MRGEDADLVAEMHRSLCQVPPWQGFLRRLSARLGASMASVMVQGPNDRAPAIHALPQGHSLPSAEQLRLMRYQRVYSGEDFPHVQPFRAMRVRVDGGGDAWVMVQKPSGDFSATASAVLTLIADNLAIAAARYVQDQAAQIAAHSMAETLARLHLGWAVVEVQQGALATLATGGAMPPRLNLPPVMAAKLLASLRQGHTAPLAAQADGLQFLALPSAAPGPRAIVYVQSAHSFAAPAALLAEFTGLTLAEARFVAQLAQGKTIAQAGQDLNLTAETARYYSKQAYAKLAAPSQTALMRQIETSILRLLPPAPQHNPNVKIP